MLRTRGLAVILILLLGAACSSGGDAVDEAGTCEVGPRVVCRDQDLRNVSLVAADLQGVDLSGSDLSFADLRNANLEGAKLVGVTLAATDFTGASLKGADLSRAFLFSTNLTDADMTGTITKGAQQCNVIDPDGALTPGSILGPDGVAVPCGPRTSSTTAGARSTGAPRIEYFRPSLPKRCINDAVGTGIDVEWSAPNANTLTFLVDGIRIESATKARGTKRLPFLCDGKVHIVTLQAFGAELPSDQSFFTAALRPTAPLTNDE